MTRQIALISEHASLLATLGGVDSGGQNVYVGQLAKNLVASGYEVDVFTRRDSELLPEIAEWVQGVRIIHVPAGPATYVRKEALLPYMDAFTEYMLHFCRCQRKAYDIVHANFWMSGLVAAELKQALGIPSKLLDLFRRQAIQRANDLFTWQRVTATMTTVYEELLGAAATAHEYETAHLAAIDQGFDGLMNVLQEARRRLRAPIMDAAALIGTCFVQQGKVLLCGNGGSAAEAQHCAAEFVGRFKRADRPGLPAVALTADTAFVTAWSNDTGYEHIFARQIEALGRTGDVLIGLSTSGRSRNLIQAFQSARRGGMQCIALLGGDGGELLSLADVAVVVPSTDTQHIQELQLVIIHLLCGLVEERMLTGYELKASVVVMPAKRDKVRRQQNPALRRRSRVQAGA